jgi:hypothetical protein
MAKEIKKISILPFLVCGVAALLIEVFATEFTEMERISENQGIRKGQVTREILAL